MPRYTTVHFKQIAQQLALDRYVTVQTVANLVVMFQDDNERFSSELFWDEFTKKFNSFWNEEPFNRV